MENDSRQACNIRNAQDLRKYCGVGSLPQSAEPTAPSAEGAGRTNAGSEEMLRQIGRQVEQFAYMTGLQVFEVLARLTVILLAPHCEKEGEA